MKRVLLLSVLLFSAFFASAQIQHGCVKTKGRMDAKGNLIPGEGLKGTTVSVQGRSAVLVNKDDGAFSFPVTEARFRLDSVKKKGYQLVDMEACPRTYKYSSNPLYIVMETPDQQLQDQLAAERKIRRNLQKQLQEKEDEIEELKAQQKITDEEYRLALQKLYQDQESNEQLISDMAKRYSELDYDQLDEFYRQVSYCIENGQLTKADSLLKTRGDITAQVGDILQRGQNLQEERSQLEKAEAVQQADIEEAARRCYSYYETFAAQHLNDTAAYYLGLRASLDTTNVRWQLDAGSYAMDFIGDYDNALFYYHRALQQALTQHGEIHPDVAISYNDLGVVYVCKGEYEKALENYNKSLQIRKTLLGEDHPDIATVYSNLGVLYRAKEEYDKAMEFHGKALQIRLMALGEDHPDVAVSYNNLGVVCNNKGDCDKALEYHDKALQIRRRFLGEEQPQVAASYNNLGAAYSRKEDYDSALECYLKALDIWVKVLGENHPDVALSYNNIGNIYGLKGEFNTALKYTHKALEVVKSVFGEDHVKAAIYYNNIGFIYEDMGEFGKALEYYNKVLPIWMNQYGMEHPNIADAYTNIGIAYEGLGEYGQALECLYKALDIMKKTLGEDHRDTVWTQERIAQVQAKMKETEK